MAESHNHSLRPVSRADSEKTATRSVGDMEKNDGSVLPSEAASVLDTTTAADPKSSLDKQQANEKVTPEGSDDDDDDDFEYPTKWKLAATTAALCLSVFCMALVRPPCSRHGHHTT